MAEIKKNNGLNSINGYIKLVLLLVALLGGGLYGRDKLEKLSEKMSKVESRIAVLEAQGKATAKDIEETRKTTDEIKEELKDMMKYLRGW